MSVRDGKDSVSFEVVGDRKLKVLGILKHENHTFDAAPAPFVKDEIVTLVVGPYPLTDYRDTSAHRAHTYVVERANGQQVSGILHSFSYDCTLVWSVTVANPELEILFPKVESNASSSQNPILDD